MSYKARLTAPSTTNKYYIHTSKGGLNSCIMRDSKTGSVLPNCVGYAWGRFYEILGSKPKLARTNAENWYGHKDGYERGSKAKLGAVACWRKGVAGNANDGAGHVAIVEEIKADGTIVTSNSYYSGARFGTQTLKPPYKLSGLTFQGFIYNPAVKEENNDNGKYYEVVSPRYIRTKPSMDGRIKLVKECTTAMQPALTSTNKNAKAQIKKGKTITSLGVTKESNGRKWIKNYSGYVCLEGKDGDIFLKKVG